MLNFPKIAASLLLGIMLFCVSKNSLLLALYKLDTSTFVTLFCENKGRPKMHCNGKCKLMQLAREQDKKDGAIALNNLQTEIFLYYQEPFDFLNKVLPDDLDSNRKTIHKSNRYSFIYLSRQDKPPEFLS